MDERCDEEDDLSSRLESSSNNSCYLKSCLMYKVCNMYVRT